MIWMIRSSYPGQNLALLEPRLDFASAILSRKVFWSPLIWDIMASFWINFHRELTVLRKTALVLSSYPIFRSMSCSSLAEFSYNLPREISKNDGLFDQNYLYNFWVFETSYTRTSFYDRHIHVFYKIHGRILHLDCWRCSNVVKNYLHIQPGNIPGRLLEGLCGTLPVV